MKLLLYLKKFIVFPYLIQPQHFNKFCIWVAELNLNRFINQYIYQII